MLHLTPGTVFAKDFRVLRPLAEGGMGAVYVVEQLSTGRERALKVLLPKVVDDPRNREGFGLEARVGSRIASEHVVEIVAAGIDDATGAPWLAMELLRGECLWDRVARAGPLSREQASVLFDQLGDALSKAHRAGVVHRDLKPENLFVAEARIKGVPFVLKVLDFGIARLIAHDRTAATSTRAIGSPLWLAPEQTQSGAKLRPATDVWALGLIAFWSLTGRSFWRAANSEEFNLTALLMEVAVNPIPAASTRAAELGVDAALPPGFDAWFARCVTRAPEDRHVDAGAAIPALLALLSATTSTAPRPRTEVLDDPLPIAPTAAMPVVPPGPPAQTVAMPVVPIAPPPKTEAMPVVPMVRSTTEAMPVAPSPTGPQTAGRVPATTPQSGGWLVPAGLGAATLLAVGVWASQRPSTTVDAQDGSAVIAAQDASEGSPATPVVGGPAEIMVRHILVQYRGVQRAVVGVTRTRDEALRRAQEAHARAVSGDDFAALAAQFSDERGAATNGGHFGRITRGRVIPAFERAAFALERGGISPVTETPFGFEIILRTDGTSLDRTGDAVSGVHPQPTTPDPHGGTFALSEATAGLGGSGPLVATLATSQGALRCTLFEDRAPNTVANFVGLARGLRAFWDPVGARWSRRPFYDGSIFHRVIPGFMIQGGDALRSGMGGTGYEIRDENVNGHDAAGLLCMANHGPHTNGGQFFITEAPVTRLDGSYSIFGRCAPTSVVTQIATVPRSARDRPTQPVFIERVTIARAP